MRDSICARGTEEKFTDINEESGHGEKDKNVSEETMLANKQTNKQQTKTKIKIFILHKCSEIFHNINHVKYKILKIDSDLERKIMFYQSIEKMIISYHKLHG